MENPLADKLTTGIVPRVIDLRAEFEAQLRAIARLEEQVKKSVDGRDPGHQDLASVLQRELVEMLDNNKNIHDVLLELRREAAEPLVAG